MMEKINIENYEAYFLDFAEGNLSEAQLLELELFLGQHPRLKEELDEFESIVLEEEKNVISFDLKSTLEREETTGLLRLDYLMIAEVEGTISAEEKRQLGDLIKQSPEKMDDLAMYHRTKLKQEEGILFTGKSALLQKEKKIIVWWPYVSSVAAAILVLFLLNFSFVNDKYSPRGFAWQETATNEEESAQHQLVAQEIEKIEVTLKEKKAPVKELNRSFASNAKPVAKPVIQEESPIEEEKQALIPEPGDNLAQIEEAPKQEKEVAETDDPITEDEGELAYNEPLSPKKEKFIPIQEFAKSKIKDGVLKGKTFSETVLEEIAEASNEKITFEQEKDKRGNTKKFALNIGKFSISKNN